MSELKRDLYGSPADDRSQIDREHAAADANAENEDVLAVQAEHASDDPALASDQNFSRRLGRGGKRRYRRLTLSVLPTLLTLGNGVCGLAAIAVATSLNLSHWDDGVQLLVAGLLIFVGMLFDALDGSAARMTGAESEFGAELDSLCDAITFGAAPAVLVWRFADGNALPPKLVWAIGVLYALCVLIRLARFNIETDEDDTHEGFDGLPSPAAAGTLAALAIAMPELAGYTDPSQYNATINRVADMAMLASQYFLPILALMLAYLMVSRFRYPHIFQRLVRGRRAPHQIGQAMFVIIGVAVLHWLAIPIAFLIYAFSSPIQSWRRGEATTAADDRLEKGKPQTDGGGSTPDREI